MNVVNSATYKAGEPLAPGSLATAFGTFMGVTETTASTTPLPTTLGGARLLVAGNAALLLYVSPTQINFVVPSSAETGIAEVQVLAGGQPVAEGTIEIRPSTPFLFLRTFGATPVALALNADGTINSESKPAAPGSSVTLFATGIGAQAVAENVGAMLHLSHLMAQSINPEPPAQAVTRVQIPIPAAEGLSGQQPVAIHWNGGSSNTASIWIR